MSAKKATLRSGHNQLKRRWTWWLVPKPFDLVTSLLYISIPLSHLFATDCDCPPFTELRATLMLGAVLVLLAIDRLEYWFYGETTPVKAAIALLITRILLIEVVAQLDYFRFSTFLYFIIPLLASLYFGSSIGYGFMGFAWLLFVVEESWLKPGWLGRPNGVHDLIIYTIGLIFAMAMAKAFLKERSSRANAEHLLTELEESHQQLKAYSEQVAELATTKERNRLARDIHDTLGHYLTVINVQLEKALVFRDRRPHEADQAIRDAKRLASEALQDVRGSVSTLRTNKEIQPFVPTMIELVEHMQTSQCSVELQIDGNEEGFSKQALMALYRVAQEGLTNVQKHAKATHALVTLHIGEESASLSLSDNGCGFDPTILHHLPPGREGGYGLWGLQERLELVGGSLSIESAPGKGTHLLAVVPKDGYVQGAAEKPQEPIQRPEVVVE